MTSPITRHPKAPASAGVGPAQGQRGFASRRGLLVAGGLAAAAGGFWFGMRGTTGRGSGATPGDSAQRAGQPAQASASSASAPPAPAPADAPLIQGDMLTPAFWQQVFDAPDGRPLALGQFQGKPLVINFWATWCPPCVKEMPELDRFSRDFSPQGGHVLGLAIDGPTPVKQFLTKVRVGFAIGLAGFGGTEMAQALGNTAGGLPFTVLIDAQGRIRQRKMGATSHAELAAWARGLKPT